ncbi:MAG TPA: hypothetical protein VFF73_40185 [Planctomycetota bacterium]|nr:hypothetical protein [Planctomycetota bacterium]
MKKIPFVLLAVLALAAQTASAQDKVAYVELQVSGQDAPAPLEQLRVDLASHTWKAADGNGFDRRGEGPLTPALDAKVEELASRLAADPPHAGILGPLKRFVASGPSYEVTVVTASDPPRTIEWKGSLEKPGSDAAFVELLGFVRDHATPETYEIGLPGEKVRTSPTPSPLEEISSRVPGGGILRAAGSLVESAGSSILGLYRGALGIVEDTAKAARGTAEAVQGTVKAVEGTVKAVEGTARAVQGTAEAARGTASAVEKTVGLVKSGFGLRRGSAPAEAPARTRGLSGLLQDRVQDGTTRDSPEDR